MPSLKYNGPSFNRRSPDVYTPDFTRGEIRDVSQGWVDTYRRFLVEPAWTLMDDEPLHNDAGGDGIPDSEWRRNEILSWLAERGIVPTGAYTTKSTLLKMVEEHSAVEEVVPVLEPVETISEPTEDEAVETITE
tara:strand:- start:50 stop:451 length:402 start_codon:yes stop_codon:yes gene_type:complete